MEENNNLGTDGFPNLWAKFKHLSDEEKNTPIKPIHIDEIPDERFQDYELGISGRYPEHKTFVGFDNGSKLTLAFAKREAQNTNGITLNLLNKLDGHKIDNFWLDEIKHFAKHDILFSESKRSQVDRLQRSIDQLAKVSLESIELMRKVAKSMERIIPYLEQESTPYINHQRVAAKFRRKLDLKKH